MTEGARGPVQVEAEVLTNKRTGAYQHLTLLAPGVAERYRPGCLVALAVGSLSERLLRRAFPIYRVRASTTYRSTLEVVVHADEDPGRSWLADQPAGTRIDVVGPLGRPYALPKEPVACLLAGSGHHAAPLFGLAERLRERGCTVHMLLGAPTERGLFGVLDAKRAARTVVVATEDGSVGMRGSVGDVLPGLLGRTPCDVVYAAGAGGLLHAAAVAAEEHGAWSQTALDPALVCTSGACLTCAVPVVGEDGVPRMVRSCVEGPVFRGDRVRWADLAPAAGTSTAGSDVAQDVPR
jgi:dihydroorotate dehydrogenase electron transfer subunit